MKNKKIIEKLTHGMYVLTTYEGGCFVDAVCQVSAAENPLIIVSVLKTNNTNELMHKNNEFALSIFGTNSDKTLIKTYGMNSMRDFDKFTNSDTIDIDGLKVMKSSVGYIICEKIDTIENDTHTVFIGRIKDGDILNDGDVITYGYYQEHKDEFIEVKTETGKTAWVCSVCGFVYYGDDLPDDYICPMCGVGKEFFIKE